MNEDITKKEILIFYNKKKSLYLFFLSSIFIILPFSLFIIEEEQIIYLLLTILGLLYFAPFMVWHFSRIFIKKPAIVINSAGINDNSGFLSVGHIEWENIKNIKTSNIFGKTYIVIDVNNKNDILSRQNLLKKFFININSRLILIQANNLKSNLEELYKTLADSFQENKKISEIEKEANVVKQARQSEEKFKVYTKNSISIASFFGGPMAGLYMISENFLSFGNKELSKKTFRIGIISTIMLFGSIALIPENIMSKIPSYIIPFIYTLFIYQYASSSQGIEIDEHIKNNGKRYSGWKVTGIIILSFLLSLLYFLLLIFILGLF